MPATPDFFIRIESSLLSVRLLARAVRAVCEETGADEAAANDVELALVEAATNIVEHGYGGSKGHLIVVEVQRLADGLELRVTDHGQPIPQQLLDQAANPPETDDPEQLAERGRGLFLLHALMDAVGYQAGADGNVLTLKKCFSPAAP